MNINGFRLKYFGLRQKLFITVLAGVILSIGITTFINAIRFSKNLLVTKTENIYQVSLTTERYTADRIIHHLDLLNMIAIAETVKDQIRIENSLNIALSEDEIKQKIDQTEAVWGNENAEEILHTIFDNRISNFLFEFRSIHQDESEVFITDASGMITSLSNKTTDYWQGDEEWWQKTIVGKTYVSNPTYDESSNTWAILASVPVFETDSSSEVIGVVRGTIDITPTFETVFDADLGDNSFGGFIGNDGRIYYEVDGELVVEYVPEDILLFINSGMAEKTNEITDMFGIASIASKKELRVGDYSLGWIITLIHKAQITEIINEFILSNIFVGFILSIVLGGISLIISNFVLNVLRNLKKDAARLAVGDYSYHFSDALLNVNDPEISSLVDSLEKMKSAIQTRENRIREREKEYRQLVETMSEGLVVANIEGTITYVNPRLCQMLGFEHNEILGKSFINFFPPDRRQTVLGFWNKVSGDQGAVYEAELCTKKREVVYVAISTEPQYDDLGKNTGHLAVITDISDRKMYELNLQRKLNEINGLREIDTAILEHTSYPNVIDSVLTQFRDHLDADGAAIYVVSPVTNEVEFASAFFLDDSFTYEDMKISQARVNRISEMKEGCQIDKVNDSLLISDHLRDKNINVLYIMPIIINNTFHGIAEIVYFDDVTLDDEWHNYFTALLTQTAVGISKIQLVENLRKSNVELKEAYDGIIRGWAKALELRDEETKGHSNRVLELSIKMAERNQFSDSRLEAFKRGALLHDIGKMGIPDSILLKPGKLTPEEWDIMKLHPDLAYVLLSEIPFLKEAIEIPYYHHERWNGSGYPSGLKGEEIPLSARIFAVIDVWDALTSDRPYRGAWTIDKTREYMLENRGVLFDRDIVDQFFDLLKEEGIFN